MVSSYRDPGKRDCIQVVTCCIPSLLGIDHFQASTKTQCLCWYQGTDGRDGGRNLGFSSRDEWVLLLENHSIFGASPSDPKLLQGSYC